MKVVKIKPIGINQQYKGRRFLTKEGSDFKKFSKLLIKKCKIESYEKLGVYLEFGFSNVSQDIDGPIKSCIDILQEQLGFNDKIIYDLQVKKRIVKKGMEYWSFSIYELKE